MNCKPNILILMTDQQRYDCMGCAGHPMVKTPNMDKLAEQGIRFTETTTVSPVCMPARASFINAVYPHNHGMWWNSGEMPPNDPTIFHLLHKAGYYNAHIGKAHYYVHKEEIEHMKDREPYMHARGFDYVHETTGPFATQVTRSYMTDEWEGKGLYEIFNEDYNERAESRGLMVRQSPLPVEEFPDSYVGRKTVEFIRNYDKDKPVCLFAGFGGPHDPWDAPGEYATMYDPAETPGAIPFPEKNRTLPEVVRNKHDLQGRDELTPEITRNIQANYFGKITLVDYWFGQILEAAKRKGWDNLLVIFWSDHGELLGDHGKINKCTFHETSVRVPLILSWPGVIPEGAVSDSLTEIIDVFPTLTELLGIDAPVRCLGKSLVSLFTEQEKELREFQLSEISVPMWGDSRNTMIRNHKYKYVVDQQGRGYMLYDLEADPEEQNNLITDPKYKKLEKLLREKLLKRLLEAQYVI